MHWKDHRATIATKNAYNLNYVLCDATILRCICFFSKFTNGTLKSRKYDGHFLGIASNAQVPIPPVNSSTFTDEKGGLVFLLSFFWKKGEGEEEGGVLVNQLNKLELFLFRTANIEEVINHSSKNAVLTQDKRASASSGEKSVAAAKK